MTNVRQEEVGLLNPSEAPSPKAAAQDDEQYSAEVAGGKVVTLLLQKDKDECVMRPSVYDAAIVIPQICRSTGWPMSLTQLTVRSWTFCVLNLCMQAFILYMISQEELVMDKFAGQMHLCDFGANIQDCPGGKNCIGPSGTNYKDPGRMYSFSAWSSRNFLRDSLETLFPHKREEIASKIDPGEYGVENYWCRFICVFIFMMSVMSDLRSTLDMIYIHWYVPSRAEPWIEYRVPQWASKAHVKEVGDLSELDFVKFKLAGMPLKWKCFNMLIILPKIWIWRMTASNGVTFLMETAGIEDVIVNVTALTFILNLDEMIFDLFSHKAVHHILEKLEPYSLTDTEELENHTPEQARQALENDKKGRCLDMRFFPTRPFLTLFFTAVFIAEYYLTYCEVNERGGYVSKAVALPKQIMIPILTFITNGLVRQPEGAEYWSFAVAE